MNLPKKILAEHLAKASAMVPGEEIYIKVDQTLTHDINAVMTYLAFEAIGLLRTQVETSVSYLDHNLLYVNSMTPAIRLRRSIWSVRRVLQQQQ